MLFKNSIGIDIHEDRLALAWLRGGVKGITVQAVGKYTKDPGKKDRFFSFVEESLIDFSAKNKIESFDIFIGIPERAVLIKDIELPYSVKDELDSVLGYEVEKFIPIPLKEIAFTYEKVMEDKASDKIRCRLAMVKREVLQPFMDLKNYIPGGMTGIMLTGISLEKYTSHLESGKRPLIINRETDNHPDPDKDTMIACALAFHSFEPSGSAINFLPEKVRKKPGKTSLYIFMAMAIACILVFSIMSGSMILRNRIENQQLDSELASLTRDVIKVEDVENKIKVLEKTIHEIQSIADGTPSCLEIIGSITAAVPKTAWLDEFVYKEGKIRIKGTADNASVLIGPLEASTLFSAVGFDSKISIKEKGQESFSIKMELENRNEK